MIWLPVVKKKPMLALFRVTIPHFITPDGDTCRKRTRRRQNAIAKKRSMEDLKVTVNFARCFGQNSDLYVHCILFQGSDSDEGLNICTPGFEEMKESSKLNQPKKLLVAVKKLVKNLC